MDVNIPEEIKEKLKIIEKEAIFSNRIKSPGRNFLTSIVYILAMVGSLVLAIYDNNFYQAGFFLLLGSMYILSYLQHKELYKLHSNACDIIQYYRNREVKK